MKLLVSILGLLCLAGLAFWLYNRKRFAWVRLMQQAQAAAEGRDWPRADRLMRQAMRLAGSFSGSTKDFFEGQTAILWSGMLYRAAHLQQAEETLRQGLARLESSCPGHQLLDAGRLIWVDILADQGRYSEAERIFDKFLRDDPHPGYRAMTIFYLQRLGDLLIQQKRFAEAQETIERCMKLEAEVTHASLRAEGKEPSEYQVISMSLPDYEFCRGRWEDARRLFQEKAEFFERSVTRPDNITFKRTRSRVPLTPLRSGAAS